MKKRVLEILNKLSFRKVAVEVTQDLLDSALKLHDTKAENILAEELLKTIHAAMKHFEITKNVSYDEWREFEGKTAMHMWEYSIHKYNPEISKFSTFVFNHVRNMWINWQRSKKEHVSLEAPVGEEGTPLGEMIEDPLAAEFASEVEAQIILNKLLDHITNPWHKEVLKAWLEIDPGAKSKERTEEAAEVLNKKYPEQNINPYRVYRIIRDVIKPMVLDLFPEAAPEKGYEKSETGEWVRKPVSPVEEVPVGIEEKEEEEIIPVSEEPAPVYRIDPQTGERVRIGLNMKKQIIAAQDMWFGTLMTFLSIELYDRPR